MFLSLAFLLLSCITHVAANSGEDFSNNLGSDLAPLLALFGERVTMQFMSQSMGWADNIILSMAPLGIITIIVSAIRVGGPSWLKYLVGRARENMAVAEADLMSSTSNEVCELWNGHHVVRCMGSAPISEFICLMPKSVHRKDIRDFRVISLDEALDKGYIKKIRKSFTERWKQIHGFANEHDHSSLEQGEPNYSLSEAIIIHSQRDAAPNISLNCHGQICRGELYLVAIFATLLQAAVLVYSGYVGCHMKSRKDEDVIEKYALPLTTLGTSFLVAGLLICAHVVETSTEEESYCPMQGTEARLVWLQRPKTVSDQVFDSYAITPRKARSIITTSSRKAKAKLGQATSSVSSQDSGDYQPDKDRRLSIALGAKTIIGSTLGLVGFISQFVGLRGMHWSVSVVLLGAMLIMVVMRALVRRGLAKPPVDRLLDPGFELDWFALTQVDPDKTWWKSSGPDATEGEASGNWRVTTAAAPGIYSPLRREIQDPLLEETIPSSKAHQAMMIRKELGQCVTWPSATSVEAAALARSIEITMNTLLVPSWPDRWSWSLNTDYTDEDGESEVHFSLRPGDPAGLESLTKELEATLSLWLFSVNRYENGQDPGKGRYLSLEVPHRTKECLQQPTLRLLGKYDKSLHRDLDWWMPHDATSLLRVQEYDWRGAQESEIVENDDTQRVLNMQNHRTIGCGFRESSHSAALPGQTLYQSSSLRKLDFDSHGEEAAAIPRAEGSSRTYLAAETSGPLKLLYAQEIFAAFMWSMAKTMPSCIPGLPDFLDGEEAKRTDWKSFKFHHEEVSRMVQDISNTGLGSLDQIYLCAIPPLSAENKLPETTKIIDLALKQAKPAMEKQDWMHATRIFLWLFETAQTFPKDSAISIRTLAVLLEYARMMADVIDLRKRTNVPNEPDDGSEIEDALVEAKTTIEDKITQWVGPSDDPETWSILTCLRTLYEEQGREWRWDTPEEFKTPTPETTTEYPQAFGLGKLHRLYQKARGNLSIEIRAALKQGQGINQQDVFHWTPLHYCSAKGNAEAAKRLLQHGADVSVQDLVGWTPLHLAAANGHDAVVEVLAKNGAHIGARNWRGETPLHLSVERGHRAVAGYLAMNKAKVDDKDFQS
ncbi:hypothetical protein CEP54_014574 [Fusarium duplospermum]|uniref:Uncharacterized protein n=1 Tax=Fusarium duplospermum TaxID=1325734 RepID=A0A428NV80_9HYPO|nr:hypothetical protein CEP54_014574 [Fusarium duplospermum]